MNTIKKMYIDGQLVTSSEIFDVINPANAEVAGTIAWGNKDDAERALISAQEAFKSWSRLPVEERAQWMRKLREAIAKKKEYLCECIHIEMGKSWASAQEDFSMLLDSLDFYANCIHNFKAERFADKGGDYQHTMVYEPVGVAVAFLAWNFPLLNLAYKLGPAMAAGCPIVVKPSFKTPLSAYAVGEICAEIGLPAGVINIVCGEDGEIGDTLSKSKIPALITLIGSTQTGLHVMKTGATSIKRYSMELGGNAPAIVCADADLDIAADVICSVKYSNAGQVCVTPNRVFVDKSIAAEFTDKILARTKSIKVGFDRHSDVDMGPVIDQAAWQRIDQIVQQAVRDGANALIGGGYPEGFENSCFYAPTILNNIDESMAVYRQEIFGPVISLIEFSSEDTVLEQANDTEAGLSSFIFTRDTEKAERFAKQLRFGEVQINGIKYAIDLMHGGMKQSGIGCDCSELALHDYLTPKRISRAL
ncbi:aldehyde dehydrogenase family protein [Marinomonas agarivorans]|nr:aldehyde dehydrogenase family protein [Marinomonas agarivorans]